MAKYTYENLLAYCEACDLLVFSDDGYDGEAQEWMCPDCGGPLLRKKRFDRAQIGSLKLRAWLREVHDAGLWGPSPGGASAELRCSRSMVDKLVGMGILERCEYESDGHKIVMISSRSIARAKKAKEQDGKWTDAPAAPGEKQ